MSRDGGLGSTEVAFVTDQAGTVISLRLWEKRRSFTSLPVSFTLLADLLDGIVANPAAAAIALLNHFASLGAVLCAEERQLAEIPGMTVQAARLLRVAYATTTHALHERVATGKIIANWHDLERWLKAEIASREGAWSVALLLNRRNVIIREQALIGTFSIDRTRVLKAVLAAVLETDAAAVIVASSILRLEYVPSHFEGALTLAQALSMLGVALHDHVVLGRDYIRSLRKENLL